MLGWLGAAGEQSRGLTHSDSGTEEWDGIWLRSISCLSHAARTQGLIPNLPGLSIPWGPSRGLCLLWRNHCLGGNKAKFTSWSKQLRWSQAFRMQFPVSPFPFQKQANAGQWEMLLHTAQAAVAVGGGDVVTSVGIPKPSKTSRASRMTKGIRES